jgi:hypothetical protein
MMEVLSQVMGFLIGVVVGMLIKFGYLHIRGRRILIPFVSHSSRNFTIVGVVLVTLSLLTIVNVELNARESAECDRQFRAALTYNVGVTREQDEITERARGISAERRALLDDTFIRIGRSLSADDPVQRTAGVNDAVDHYVREAKTLSQDYDELLKYRDGLNSKRKAYPEPLCGLQ